MRGQGFEDRAAGGQQGGRGRRWCREGDRETVTHCGWAGLARVASARSPSSSINLPSGPTGWSRGCSLSLPVSGVIQPNCAEAAGPGQASSARHKPSQPGRLPDKLSHDRHAPWAVCGAQPPPAPRLLHGQSDLEPNPLSVPEVAPGIN